MYQVIDTYGRNEQASILKYEHISLFDFVLQDIEEGHNIILINCYLHKKNTMQNDNTYYNKFPWKQTLIQQPLEGAATYIGKGRIVYSKRVPV